MVIGSNGNSGFELPGIRVLKTLKCVPTALIRLQPPLKTPTTHHFHANNERGNSLSKMHNWNPRFRPTGRFLVDVISAYFLGVHVAKGFHLRPASGTQRPVQLPPLTPRVPDAEAVPPR